MPDPNKVVEVLRAALAKMNESGKHWTKGRLHNYDFRGENMYCSLGAILEATGVDAARVAALSDDGRHDEADEITNAGDVETREAAVFALASAVPEPVWGMPGRQIELYNNITHWNDRQAEGWEEVQAVFAKAQEIALAAGDQP